MKMMMVVSFDEVLYLQRGTTRQIWRNGVGAADGSTVQRTTYSRLDGTCWLAGWLASESNQWMKNEERFNFDKRKKNRRFDFGVEESGGGSESPNKKKIQYSPVRTLMTSHT